MSPGSLDKIPSPTAELLGTFAETLGYGIYIAVLPQCLRIVLRRNGKRTITAVVVICIVVNFLLITLHILVDLVRTFTAFTADLSVGGAAEIHYASIQDINTSLNVTKNAVYYISTLLTDAFLVYRTFIVWGHNYPVIILPILLFLLDFVISVWSTWTFKKVYPGSSILVSTALERSKYFPFTTLALNLVCTVLIAFKIWKVRSQAAPYVSTTSRGANVLSIILESATIYVAALICLIGTLMVGSSLEFFWFNLMPPLNGLVFSYIILRSSTNSQDHSIPTCFNFEACRDSNTQGITYSPQHT